MYQQDTTLKLKLAASFSPREIHFLQPTSPFVLMFSPVLTIVTLSLLQRVSHNF